jgi:thiol:disulfide interchange protein
MRRFLFLPRALFLLIALASCEEAPSRAATDPFLLRTDAELDAAIRDARDRARASGRKVLLELVAEWCADCREVVRVSGEEPARSVLEERYVVVHVNVGRFDRHRELLREHEVDRIATLVVLDPETGRRVARTTLEPISTGDGLRPEELAAWLRSPTGS